MGTLESRFSERVAEFRRRSEDVARRAAAGEDVAAAQRQLQQDECEYLLSAVPFIKEYVEQDTAASPGGANAGGSNVEGPLSKFVELSHKTTKNTVLQRYLMHVERQVDAVTVAAVTQDNAAGDGPCEYVCPACDVGMRLDARESALVCPQCGLCRPYSQMSACNLTYEQEVHQDVVTYYSYKRLNHFCEWLNSLQAKVRVQNFSGVALYRQWSARAPCGPCWWWRSSWRSCSARWCSSARSSS